MLIILWTFSHKMSFDGIHDQISFTFSYIEVSETILQRDGLGQGQGVIKKHEKNIHVVLLCKLFALYGRLLKPQSIPTTEKTYFFIFLFSGFWTISAPFS